MKASFIILRKEILHPVPPDLDDLIYLACQGKKRCFAGSPAVELWNAVTH